MDVIRYHWKFSFVLHRSNFHWGPKHQVQRLVKNLYRIQMVNKKVCRKTAKLTAGDRRRPQATEGERVTTIFSFFFFFYNKIIRLKKEQVILRFFLNLHLLHPLPLPQHLQIEYPV